MLCGNFLTRRDINGKSCKKIPCKLCDQLLADGGGTSNLLNHLQAKHPEEFKRCTDSGTQSTSKQSTLSSICVRCSAQCSASITDRLVDFVTMDLRPLSTVAGLVINDKRASLTPENADMLIFMNKNVTLS